VTLSTSPSFPLCCPCTLWFIGIPRQLPPLPQSRIVSTLIYHVSVLHLSFATYGLSAVLIPSLGVRASLPRRHQIRSLTVVYCLKVLGLRWLWLQAHIDSQCLDYLDSHPHHHCDAFRSSRPAPCLSSFFTSLFWRVFYCIRIDRSLICAAGDVSYMQTTFFVVLQSPPFRILHLP